MPFFFFWFQPFLCSIFSFNYNLVYIFSLTFYFFPFFSYFWFFAACSFRILRFLNTPLSLFVSIITYSQFLWWLYPLSLYLRLYRHNSRIFEIWYSLINIREVNIHESFKNAWDAEYHLTSHFSLTVHAITLRLHWRLNYKRELLLVDDLRNLEFSGEVLQNQLLSLWNKMILTLGIIGRSFHSLYGPSMFSHLPISPNSPTVWSKLSKRWPVYPSAHHPFIYEYMNSV